MGMWIGRNRKARVTYGFDEIALVPGRVTINPNEVDITWRLERREAEPLEFKIPILASAMDGVVDVRFAMGEHPHSGDALTWATATFEFGTDLKMPPNAVERVP